MHRSRSILLSAAVVLFAVAASAAEPVLPTPLEANGYAALPKATTVHNYLKRITESASNARMMRLGRSLDGRAISAVLVSADAGFLENGRGTGDKPRVLLIGAQHGTEPSGAEALQQVVRDILHGDLKRFVEAMDFVIVPMSNPDGRSRHKRTNAAEVNLSTDFLVQSQPETWALTSALRRFAPHVILDVHESAILKKSSLGAQGFVTDFEAQFEFSNSPAVERKLAAFASGIFLVDLLKAVNARGLRAARYIGEITNIDQPITYGGLTLRNLRNFGGMLGSVSILLENRLDPPGTYPSWRNIQVRTKKQYLSIVAFLDTVVAHRAAILARVAAARAAWRDAVGERRLPMVSAYVRDPAEPEISLSMGRYPSREIFTKTFDYHGKIATVRTIARPAAYVVRGHHEALATLLTRHRVRFERMTAPRRVPAIRQMVTAIGDRPRGPGRIGMVMVIETREIAGPADLAAGDLWIPLDQPLGDLVAQILEPTSTNTIFQAAGFTNLLVAGTEAPVIRIPR